MHKPQHAGRVRFANLFRAASAPFRTVHLIKQNINKFAVKNIKRFLFWFAKGQN